MYVKCLNSAIMNLDYLLRSKRKIVERWLCDCFLKQFIQFNYRFSRICIFAFYFHNFSFISATFYCKLIINKAFKNSKYLLIFSTFCLLGLYLMHWGHVSLQFRSFLFDFWLRCFRLNLILLS